MSNEKQLPEEIGAWIFDTVMHIHNTTRGKGWIEGATAMYWHDQEQIQSLQSRIAELEQRVKEYEERLRLWYNA
jgi:hypothetical protein